MKKTYHFKFATSGIILVHIESHMFSKRYKIETSQNVMPDRELRQVFIRLEPELDTD
jgi:hypothetical protein